MKIEKINQIIDVLELVRKNPERYFRAPDNIIEVESFLLGFHLAFFSINEEVPRMQKEGWESTYYHVPSLRKDTEKSGSDEELIQETFSVEIEAWKHLLSFEK